MSPELAVALGAVGTAAIGVIALWIKRPKPKPTNGDAILRQQAKDAHEVEAEETAYWRTLARDTARISLAKDLQDRVRLAARAHALQAALAAANKRLTAGGLEAEPCPPEPV